MTTTNRIVLAGAFALALVGLADAQTGTKSAHMSVTVTVVAQCTISTVAVLPNEAASVACTSNARGVVSDVKRIHSPMSTETNKQTQVVTILF